MRYFLIFTAVLLSAVAVAHDYVPGEKQQNPVILRGGDLYTISDGVKQQTDLLFEKGRITQIGRDLTPPKDAQVIDVTGKHVYPGLIAAQTSIGLIEIGEVRATNDRSEIGLVNPDVQTHVAYNPDSEIIPSVRANGITTALIVPGGRLITGRSSLINLDGWTVEDAAEKLNVGLHLVWPRTRVITAWWMEQSAEEQKKEMTENRRRLHQVFDDALTYYLARQADPTLETDSRWEAMVPVLAGDMPVFVTANDYQQVEQAVSFTHEKGLRMILVGGTDAWMLTDLLKEHNIPVILKRTQSLPAHSDDGYDLSYRAPALLAEAGVKFCLSSAGANGASATGARNLPLQAGQAVAFGLPHQEALRAITLSTAEILGVAADLGSLEVGKKATLIVAEGDILDPLTHRVVLEFIEGRQVDLDNRHRELYRKYQQKRLSTR
ncbi:MAG: amidohydrolase family protein [bacterium]